MNDRNLLVVAPVWPNASELWMHRMMKLTAEDCRGFATFAPKNSTIADVVPTIDLLPRWASFLSRWNVTNLGFSIGSSELRKVLYQKKVTHVLCHYATTAIHFRRVLSQLKIPLWVHCHGYDVTWTRKRLAGLAMQRYLDEIRRLADHAKLIANSEFTKHRLVEIGIPTERIEVKYIGIPINKPSRERRLTAQAVNFLFLGRLVDFKGPIETIRAFELAMSSDNFRGRLTIAGGGPLERHCREIIANSRFRDLIEMRGVVSAAEGERLRDEADVFTAHSCLGSETGQAEAFGVAFVEAMADSLPVVTGRYGGVCESIIDGETGYLFPPGDIQEHARLLVKLANDQELRNRMGCAGHLRATEWFSLERERESLYRILFE